MEGEFGKFVVHRLHPVRVTVSLMSQQLELAKAGKEVTLDRNLYQSIVSTLEIFLDEFDSRVRITSPEKGEKVVEKKFVDASKSTIKI